MNKNPKNAGRKPMAEIEKKSLIPIYIKNEDIEKAGGKAKAIEIAEKAIKRKAKANTTKIIFN